MRTIWDMWGDMTAGKSSPYTASTQYWQQSVSSFWQIPADYWQTVSAIYTARARTWQGLMNDYPAQISEIAQSKSLPELIETSIRAYGHNVSALTTLAATVQAHRMNLLRSWQASAEHILPPALRAASTTALASSWLNALNTMKGNTPVFPQMATGMPSIPSFFPWMTQAFDMQKAMVRQASQAWQNQAAAEPAAQPRPAPEKTATKETKTTSAKETSKDASESSSEPAPAPVAEAKQPQPPVVIATKAAEKPIEKPSEKKEAASMQPEAKQVATLQPKAAEAPKGDSQLTLLTPPATTDVHHTPGLNGTPHHSSTASNGVVRSSGAVVATAAAAAARRSVVARRATRSRPRIVRPAR